MDWRRVAVGALTFDVKSQLRTNGNAKKPIEHEPSLGTVKASPRTTVVNQSDRRWEARWC